MSLHSSAMGYFRSRRNKALSALIRSIPQPVHVLDVGGTNGFWTTVEAPCDLTITNISSDADIVADARNLPMEDKSYDLVVSNSLIEHVGQWNDIKAACSEMRRIGKRGWVQTPSPLFPIEPHTLIPFIHWLGTPIQTSLYRHIPNRMMQKRDVASVRLRLEYINLLTKTELRTLFPGCRIETERFMLWPKSHIVRW